jgi:hypothetical protein
MIPLLSLFAISACNKADDSSPSDSMSQQIGEAMSAIDDSGGSSGGYAFFQNGVKSVAKIEPKPGLLHSFSESLLTPAYAATCATSSTFGTCTSDQIVRDFGGCTVGLATFTGTITLTFDDGNSGTVCAIDSDNDTITRDPNFTITGPRGGTYTVTKTGSIGQRIERISAGSFEFTNDGLRRVLAFQGTTLADWTTTVSASTPILISGASRNGRIANGGTLTVLNNKTGVTCNLNPSNVTWNGSCNCAVEGSWTVSCDSGDSGSYTITGCGEGTLAIGTTSEAVTLDRCYSI